MNEQQASKCTEKQAKVLRKRGLPINVSRQVASSWINRIAANEWRVPDDVWEETKTIDESRKEVFHEQIEH